MNRFKIGKTGMLLALFAVLLSGCVTNKSSIIIQYPNDKPSEGTQVFFRYSSGEVVQVPDIGVNSSVEAIMDINKKIVGGYAETDGIAWVPDNYIPDISGNLINILNIQSNKPASAAHHVQLIAASQPSSYSGYLNYTLAVYDEQGQPVNNRTEIFLHGDDPNLEFHSLNGNGDPTVANGYSYFTAGGLGLVTFPIKSGPITKPISVYSGSKLLNDNLLSIVTDVKITTPDDVYSVLTGETLALNAAISPSNAINSAVTWSVSDQTGTARIDPTTGVLTAGDPGTVLAQAAATDGSGVVGSVQITIKPTSVLVNSITISGSNSVQAGQSIPLTASVLPADAKDPSVVWSVQDGTGKATIDGNGKLTGTTAGTVLVKAEAADLSGVFGTKTVVITTINNGSNGGNTGGNSGGNSSGGSGSPAAPTPVPTPAPTPVTPSDPSPQPTPGTDVVPGPTFNSQVLNMDSFMTSFTQKVKAAQSNPATVQLTDTTTHWAGATVTTFVKLGVVTGYTDGSFHPNASITRAEFATLITKVFDLSSNQGNTISDVSGYWAESSIRSLQSKGVLSGYPDGTFRPNQEIKRSEIIAIISRIMDLSKVPTAEAPAFSDLEQIWNKDQLQQAAAAGIIQGDRNGEFHPANSASRAEALTIILRVLQTNSEFEALLQSL
ncbi:S-layer homology domain-containing protein [Paenibacillus xylanexedens]|uniref:S-layer homology domain-containing protein n=1 Tax=Paenibacillus xylanexedens TaxID=528191 RepID=UPI001F204A45|nr:S-layer homology domain-containing protein [Paenibacillus xylanexedens]MCF7756898.1 S-layer homology domain-containing protein [Paenibacillus xylanexedens]